MIPTGAGSEGAGVYYTMELRTGAFERRRADKGKADRRVQTEETIAIRPVLEQDVGLLLGLIRELADYEKMSGDVEATEELLLDSLFRRKAARAVIAEYAGKPAGYALFFYNFSTFTGRPGIYLEDLFVRPALRGLGVGKALFSYVARLAADGDCSRMEWSCLDWNEPSIHFYSGMGALPLSGWTQYRLDRSALAAFSAAAEKERG